MKRLDQLNSIANESLGGLKAGPALRNRIIAKAREEKGHRGRNYRPILATALSFTVLLASVYAIIRGQAPVSDPVIHSIAAGQPAGQGTLRAMLDLPPGSISLTAGNAAPQYRTLWAAKSGADFPLIAIGGKYYRLMTNPTSVSGELVGERLGEISEYTSEPSLSSGGTVLSNAAGVGEAVYAINGMNGAAIAANVDGSMRVFQRVSYAGTARIGKETLNDTLMVSGKVAAVELSGVGTVTDQNTAEALVKILVDNAVYENAALITAEQSLLIQLDNGITMQLLVKGDTVSACGSWSCPEFFEALKEALGK